MGKGDTSPTKSARTDKMVHIVRSPSFGRLAWVDCSNHKTERDKPILKVGFSSEFVPRLQAGYRPLSGTVQGAKSARVLGCASAQVLECAGARVRRCSGAQVLECAGASALGAQVPRGTRTRAAVHLSTRVPESGHHNYRSRLRFRASRSCIRPEIVVSFRFAVFVKMTDRRLIRTDISCRLT